MFTFVGKLLFLLEIIFLCENLIAGVSPEVESKYHDFIEQKEGLGKVVSPISVPANLTLSEDTVSLGIATFKQEGKVDKIFLSNLVNFAYNDFTLGISCLFDYGHYDQSDIFTCYTSDLMPISAGLPVLSKRTTLAGGSDMPNNRELWKLLVEDPFAWHEQMLATVPYDKLALEKLDDAALNKHLYFLSLKFLYSDRIDKIKLYKRSDGVKIIQTNGTEQVFLLFYFPKFSKKQTLVINPQNDRKVSDTIITELVSSYDYVYDGCLTIEQQRKIVYDSLFKHPKVQADQRLLMAILDEKEINIISSIFSKFNCLNDEMDIDTEFNGVTSVIHGYPIIAAICYNRPDVLDQLLKNHVNLNVTDQYGETPINIAFSEGKDDIAKMLLNAGADINIVDKFNGSAYDYCVHDEYLPMSEKGRIPATIWNTGINKAMEIISIDKIMREDFEKLNRIKINYKQHWYVFIYETKYCIFNADTGSVMKWGKLED